jgi:hypothetical protein
MFLVLEARPIPYSMIYTRILDPTGRESVSTSNAHSVVRERTSSGGLSRSSSAGSSTMGSLVGAECLSGANSSSATDILRLVVPYIIPKVQRRM